MGDTKTKEMVRINFLFPVAGAAASLEELFFPCHVGSLLGSSPFSELPLPAPVDPGGTM